MDVNAILAALDAVRSEVQIATVDHPNEPDETIPIFIHSTGNGRVDVQSIKGLIDEWRMAPDRRKGTARTHTLSSFVELVNRHKDVDTAIFADLLSQTCSVTAVVDYHTMDGQPRFGQHRIGYQWPTSPEWSAWQKANGLSMSQADWCAFVEDHIAELAAPTADEIAQFGGMFQTSIATPAELIQLSRGMSITVESRVKEVRVLQTGESQVVYEETHRAGDGGVLTVPGLFVAQIPLYLGAAPDRLIARLRYRKAEGRLAWFYQLFRPDLVVRGRLQNDLATISQQTQLPVYEGGPEI